MLEHPVSTALTVVTEVHADPADTMRDLGQMINDSRDGFAHQIRDFAAGETFSVSVVSLSHTLEESSEGRSFATAIMELQAR
ncbi:hypothetical protein [Rothia uropygialis]|uniref:hypothetical protein n=1 Tax=Kocuria sp. 36 TaxID=1415402 RepID=UPI00101CF315|nr:hypothetical protein [Kocuria sp. 36]